ncbi:DUF2975 domain-containing protein [Cytobacillus sp. Hm23]
MKKVTTLLLKIAIGMIGVTVLALCIDWLPWQANVLEAMYPEFAHLKYPLLIGIYMTAIPFFFALYQALKLLSFIDKNKAFSNLSVKSLNYITYCATTICILYVIGFIILHSQNAENPGILILGWAITFVSFVIAIFAVVLKKLLQNAIHLKAENDLTV